MKDKLKSFANSCIKRNLLWTLTPTIAMAFKYGVQKLNYLNNFFNVQKL